jgi:Mor family transcriptional regulator
MTKDLKDDGYPDILLDLLDRLPKRLTNAGIDRAVAEVAADVACEFIRSEWGGQKLYVPMGTPYTIKRRNRHIRANWNGRNTRELCHLYRISEARLRQIINKKEPN